MGDLCDHAAVAQLYPGVGRSMPDAVIPSKEGIQKHGFPIGSGMTSGSSIRLRMRKNDGGHTPPHDNRRRHK